MNSSRTGNKKKRTHQLFAVVVFAVLLFGCGDFNLFEIMDSELVIKPEMVSMRTGGRLTFEASQGVPPYRFQLSAGSGRIDEDTGEYQAPDGSDDVEISVVDASGKQAVASVFVVEPFFATPDEAAIEQAKTLNISVSGGRAPYLFSIVGSPINTFDNGQTEFATSGTSCVYQGSLVGSDTVQIEDSLGSLDLLQITVFAEGGSLYITPGTAQVEIGGTAGFTIGGGSAPYTFATISGSVSPNPLDESGTIVYTASGVSGTDTITVTDDAGDSGWITITVVSEALRLIPSETITLYVGDTFGFSAAGGIEPYYFFIDPEDVGDAAIDPDTGLFKALSKNNTVIVWVSDAGDGSDMCRVKVKN